MPDSSLSVFGFVAENREWIFSGIGVFFISLLITFVVYLVKKPKKDGSSQFQKSGRNSVNIQSKGSISINGGIHNGPDSKDRRQLR